MTAAFRQRVNETASRVQERTGIDPLDISRSMAVTTDVRLERLPGSIGIGLGAMAAAGAIAMAGLFAEPSSGPPTTASWTVVVLIALLALGSAACVVVSRAAKRRRPRNADYEDAWARFAVETWPPPALQDGFRRSEGTGAYSRLEFLVAVRDGSDLARYERHAPVVRIP